MDEWMDKQLARRTEEYMNARRKVWVSESVVQSSVT